MTPEGYARVFVGGLNDSIKKEDLQMEFEKYGKLNKVWVAFNPPGFAFIEFFNMNEAESACSNMHGTEIKGVKLRVEISRGRGRGGSRSTSSGGFRGSRGSGNRDYNSRNSSIGYRGSSGYGDYSSGGSYYSGRASTNWSRGRSEDDYPSSRVRDYPPRRNTRYASDMYGSSGTTNADYYASKNTVTSRYRSRSPANRGRY